MDARNENVSDFRYALVESDGTDLEKQNAIFRELELPVACLGAFSGRKSSACHRARGRRGACGSTGSSVDCLCDVCQRTVSRWIRRSGSLPGLPGCQGVDAGRAEAVPGGYQHRERPAGLSGRNGSRA